MSTVELADKSIGGFFDVMRSQPLSLALVVMNLALLGMLWSISSKSDTQLQMIFTHQDKVQTLLSKCVVPDGKE